MNVIILSTYDSDGAGIFANQLMETLTTIGQKVQIVCVRSSLKHPNITGILDQKPVQSLLYKILSRINRLWYKPNPNYAFLETNSIPRNFVFSSSAPVLFPQTCDIIICTFLSGMFDQKTLSNFIARYDSPQVVYYGVDMNLYTGGCHYSRECLEYQNSCSNCPAVSPIAKKIIERRFADKKEIVEGLNKTIVIASSNEHYQQIKSSNIFRNANTSLLLMPVDDKLFGKYELSRELLKSKFSLKGRCILVRSSKEPRKGNDIFINAIYQLALNNNKIFKSITILSIGDQYIADQLSGLGINVYSPGYISDVDELSKIYSMSDFFINSSLADGGPMMLAQSLMSYTPVITTDVGLARDLVISGTNGTILEQTTSTHLAVVIKQYLSMTSDDLHKMRYKSREIAIRLLTKKNYITKLSNLLNIKEV